MQRRLARRAAETCSNPACNAPTTIPVASELQPTVSLGVATRIHAEGPAAVANVIWLCVACAKAVGAHRGAYSTGEIEGWKREHERSVERHGLVEPLVVVVQPRLDARLPRAEHGVAPAPFPALRQHEVAVWSRATLPLEAIDLRVQFPEPVLDTAHVEASPGVTADWLFASAVPKDGARYASEFVLHVDLLLPEQRASFFLTSRPRRSAREARPGTTEHFLSAYCAYARGRSTYMCSFVVPLEWDDVQRRARSLGRLEDEPALQLVYRQTYGDD